MANKCAHCGKYISSTDGAKCHKCASIYHRICVHLSPDAKVSPRWQCKACNLKSSRSKDTCIPQLGTNSSETENPGEKFVDAIVEDHSGGTLVHEIKLLRSELQNLSSEMVNFRQEIAKLNNTVLEFNTRLNGVESRVASLERKSTEEINTHSESEMSNTIAQLKREINDKDQVSLLNDLEVTGLPEQSGENPTHILNLVAKKIGIELDERDVVSAERMGIRRGREHAEGIRPRPIIVRLARRAIRDEMLRAARMRRGLDTAGMNITGETSRFYLNERLTQTNKHLFYKARQEARRNNWKYVWTKNGCIYVSRDSMSARNRIRIDKDLEVIFGSTLV